MNSLERSIRQIHSPPSIGGSTRSRNSALTWKDHAGSPVPAVANTPCRQRACAAPCCSPAQTSFCEQGFLHSSDDLSSVIEVDTRHHHGRYKYTLAGARACSETSAFVAFDPAAVLSLPKEGGASSRYARLGPLWSISPSTSGAHKPPSHRTSIQALGTTSTLTFHVGVMNGRYAIGGGTRKC